ncbi:preprotein translocase subunit SecE [bacterium]|nr:preprotein translocase subunit SecE [bacterium]
MENKFLQDITTYFKGIKAEWGKITWPEKNQVVVETIFVLAIVIAFTIFVYVIDLIFKFGLDLIVK